MWTTQAPSCALSLKHPQFCCSRRCCFKKDPQCSPYLLQEMMNPSFSQSLVWLYLLTLYLRHPANLNYMQSTSGEMLGWRKHKLESRLPGEISIT